MIALTLVILGLGFFIASVAALFVLRGYPSFYWGTDGLTFAGGCFGAALVIWGLHEVTKGLF